jgi:hypothetical protein
VRRKLTVELSFVSTNRSQSPSLRGSRLPSWHDHFKWRTCNTVYSSARLISSASFPVQFPYAALHCLSRVMAVNVEREVEAEIDPATSKFVLRPQKTLCSTSTPQISKVALQMTSGPATSPPLHYNALHVRDTESGTSLSVLDDHLMEVLSIAWSPGGERIVLGSASADRSLETETLKPLTQLLF